VENPGSRVVSPETNRQKTIHIETATNSVSDNGVVKIGDITLRSPDNPELMLQNYISVPDSWSSCYGIDLHRAGGMGVGLQ
jgi:hypothetical protein